MDAEGLGSKLLLTPSDDPRRGPEKQTGGIATASRKMLTLQALSSSLNAGTAKRGCLGRGEAVGCPPAVCPPERPRPFAHYRKRRKTSRTPRPATEPRGVPGLEFSRKTPNEKPEILDSQNFDPQNTPKIPKEIPRKYPKM